MEKRNILINTPQIGVALSPAGKIIFVNQHFLKITGWTQAEIMGRNWFDLFIPEDIRKEIRSVFDRVMPFFTTKDVGKGTGLGLATVYGIVKQNNGFINVYSEVGTGTTIKIYFPKFIPPSDHFQKQAASDKQVGGEETILLVEDEKGILRMATMMLERLSYKVLPASRPAEAIHIGESYPGEIHLLMTDVVMPEMSGRAVAQKLLDLYPGLKCLFMSGYTANVIAHHGVLDEGTHFINKPFSKQDLSAKIREILNDANVET